MTYYAVKILVTTLLVVAISELAKRSSFAGALLASVPLVSVLAIVWLYVETGDLNKISALATGVFWLVLPSLALFISLPLLLRQGIAFYPSLGIAMAITIASYAALLALLRLADIRL